MVVALFFLFVFATSLMGCILHLSSKSLVQALFYFLMFGRGLDRLLIIVWYQASQYSSKSWGFFFSFFNTFFLEQSPMLMVISEFHVK